MAGHLAERAWMVMNRGTPYVICDDNGQPVTPQDAKAIIAEKWIVSEEVRKRRRSRKLAGKAPQATATGPAGEATLPAPDRHAPAPPPVKPTATQQP